MRGEVNGFLDFLFLDCDAYYLGIFMFDFKAWGEGCKWNIVLWWEMRKGVCCFGIGGKMRGVTSLGFSSSIKSRGILDSANVGVEFWGL